MQWLHWWCITQEKVRSSNPDLRLHTRRWDCEAPMAEGKARYKGGEVAYSRVEYASEMDLRIFWDCGGGL